MISDAESDSIARIDDIREAFHILFSNYQNWAALVEVSESGMPGHFLEVNDMICRMSGRSRDEWLALTPFDILPPAGKVALTAWAEDFHRSGQAVFETDFRTTAGQMIPIEMTVHPLSLFGRDVALCISRNISLRKATEVQMLQVARLESVAKLAGGVAHEFNNILTGINGFAELVLRKLPDGDPAQKDLEKIIGLGNRAAELTRQLLLFSSRRPVDSRPTNVNDAVHDAMPLLKIICGRHIRIEKNCQGDLWPVISSPGQFEQILMDITINSRAAMPDGGLLQIKTENALLDSDFIRRYPGCREGRHVILSIADNGCGMDRETLRHIFEPFFTTRDVGDGTGLGLATAYGMVKQHNGHVVVESICGEGTKISIFLPAAAEE